MKNIKQLTLSVLALTAALCAPELSCAASDDECAIWKNEKRKKSVSFIKFMY